MMAKRAVYGAIAFSMIFLIGPSTAGLMPVSFGFPVLFQNNNMTAFNQDLVTSNNIESLDIGFPSFGTVMYGTSGPQYGLFALPVPMIGQRSLNTGSFMHTNFAQNSQLSVYTYPFVGVGSTDLPGFGFGF
jgi:hypothetical protein